MEYPPRTFFVWRARRLFHSYLNETKKKSTFNSYTRTLICCNLYNFSVFQPSSRAQEFGGNLKERNYLLRY